jgi:hypothetical protein
MMFYGRTGLFSGPGFYDPLQEHAWRSTRWFFGSCAPMLHSYNPENIGFDFIKKSIWRDNNLPVGKFWKFRYDSSGFRKVLKPSQDFFGSISKTGRS